jgi:hypothetical protein
MDIIESIPSNRKCIIDCIEKYGSVREHNYWFYQNQQNRYSKVFFLKFDEGGIVAIRYESGIWEFIGEVLAKEEKRLELFRSLLDYTLSEKKDKKLFVFAPEKFYCSVADLVRKSGKYKMTAKPTVYCSPVFNMKLWDKELKGKEWKKVRNARNKLLRHNDVQIIPSREIDVKKLNKVVLDWRDRRPREEMTYYVQMYLNFVKNGFEGTDIARSVVINNEPCTITAGWKIPNSNNYYSAIGLYNYKYDGLGELANIDDLTQLKEKNYDYVDFGDSEDSLLQFKKKFKPESFYNTYWFHISKK